jgi:hypothetical protein
MKGNYRGFYKYDSERVQKKLGIDRTLFNIEITETEGQAISGLVEDDLNTKGTPGVGSVSGKFHGGNISFVKQMPVSTSIGPNGEITTHPNRMHPKIYYEGIEVEEGLFRGFWKMKFGFQFFGIFLQLFIPASGTWEMQRY